MKTDQHTHIQKCFFEKAVLQYVFQYDTKTAKPTSGNSIIVDVNIVDVQGVVTKEGLNDFLAMLKKEYVGKKANEL